MNVNNITFGAIPINKTTIKRYDKNTKEFLKIPANFLKIDANNPYDMSAINQLEKKWKGAKYIQRIVTASHWISSRKFVEIDVYALSTQEKNFDKLKPNKILGIVEMRNDNNNPKSRKIYHLQVKPSAINVNNLKNKYKHVGSSILKSLKKIYKRMSVFADDNPNIVQFYIRNGFIEDYQGKNHLSWNSNIFERLKIKINAYLCKYGF